MKEDRKAFFTFSKKAYLENPGLFEGIVKTLEKECGYTIDYKWYAEKGSASAESIFQDSLQAMRKATVVVAEASSRSTSIGSQISYALNLKKPVIVFFSDTLSKGESLFLKGMKSPFLKIIYYKDFADLRASLIKALGSMPEERLEKFNFIASKSIKEALAKESERRDISTSQLLREIIEAWLSGQDRHSS